MRTILQSESSECGLACLAMIASHFGLQTDLADLRRKFSTSIKGATLAQLIRHSSIMNLAARPLRLELEELSELALPCILHWNLNHFVVLTKVNKTLLGKTTITLVDPAVGIRQVSLEEASKQFTGVALELTPTAAFKPVDERKHVSIRELTGKIIGLKTALVQVFALALALEVFAIAAPLFNQFVIDEVIVSGDKELLVVLVIGFALLMLTQTAIGLARSWFLMRWSIDIGFQWSTRVLNHLVRLPVSYFEKRHLGDIVSRFGSLNTIQRTLTNLFVESLIDGLMTILALIMMTLYSPKLTVIIVAGVALYALLRWFFYQPFQEASQEQLILDAKESSYFLETVRAIAPIKLFGSESERISRWQNLKQDVLNRDVKTQKMSILFRTSNTAIFGFQGLLMFYVGSGQVMANALSIGMLMAFSSYAATFTGRVFGLIDLFINVKMLNMHAERLGDIVLEPAEAEVSAETDLTRLNHSITLRNVKFRYAIGEPWILNGVNLTIPAGQNIALIGPSGSGKSTLCKIILGFLDPTEGEVLIGGIPITQIGLRSYRQLIGTVMQDDALLTGSIQDNICFFEARFDQARVEHCAKLASIHDEIAAFPMGYQTLVGEMGSSLSGGQKQRVLLARALYKQPKILALDEATSHLDIENEERVNHALSQLDLTRIMIAHRPETINAAERVVAIKDGIATEVRAALETSPIPS